MFIAHMKDGRTLKESEGVDWKTINTQDITSLQLLRNGKFYTVGVRGENAHLIQLKRGIIGTAFAVDVSERVIGFIIQEEGKDKYAVKLEVDEKTGNVLLTLEMKEKRGWRRL